MALVARYVLALYDSVLKVAGLSSARLHLLLAINEAHDATAAELRDLLHADLATILHLLRGLMRAKLVEPGLGRDDRRKTYRLTPRGLRSLNAYFEDWRRAQDRVGEVLGSELLRALQDAIPRIRAIPVRPERARLHFLNFYDFRDEAREG